MLSQALVHTLLLALLLAWLAWLPSKRLIQTSDQDDRITSQRTLINLVDQWSHHGHRTRAHPSSLCNTLTHGLCLTQTLPHRDIRPCLVLSIQSL
jgi:hypothetical protein